MSNMTIFEFWESFSIGTLSPVFDKPMLIVFTVFGGLIVLAEVIIAFIVNFTKSNEAPGKIIMTMYAPIYLLALVLLNSIEFILMIQMSFHPIAMSIFIIAMIVLFIAKIAVTGVDNGSLFGITGWIQTKALELVVLPGRTVFFNDYFSRLMTLYNITNKQNKYLRKNGDK